MEDREEEEEEKNVAFIMIRYRAVQLNLARTLQSLLCFVCYFHHAITSSDL